MGKTGIFDHNAVSRNQTARIYSAQVKTDASRRTADGEIYTYVEARAYMLRNEKNKDLISEIEAGIKKETSVGCSVAAIRCSICGRDLRGGACGHVRGKEYDGKICCSLLCDPQDAYEWSFVAVPAQKNAGVIKSFIPAEGENYESELRDEYRSSILRDASLLLPGVPRELIADICGSAELKSLRSLRDSLRSEAAGKSPLVRQLTAAPAEEKTNNSEYRI